MAGVALLTLAGLIQQAADAAESRGPRFRRLWAGSTAGLIAVYSAQELVEGAPLVAHGGWVAVPVAVAVGLAIAIVMRGAAAAGELGAPGRPWHPPAALRPHRPRTRDGICPRRTQRSRASRWRADLLPSPSDGDNGNQTEVDRHDNQSAFRAARGRGGDRDRRLHPRQAGRELEEAERRAETWPSTAHDRDAGRRRRTQPEQPPVAARCANIRIRNGKPVGGVQRARVRRRARRSSSSSPRTWPTTSTCTATT